MFNTLKSVFIGINTVFYGHYRIQEEYGLSVYPTAILEKPPSGGFFMAGI